ncbi:Isotrichodermin C-15 hydroxylase 13 [Colletotrichum chlorophyti]|uniref:Isotrichodermin C-15 hydroxylase 13 n=1 Tax=Colletotrichum chlorophyti TaxID=708187 RepID=A0A1Q8RT24_9PEZI|nr:Isotrichodermin C-15 hydroxylase 13 [Colletotrichum chlorophyti]
MDNVLNSVAYAIVLYVLWRLLYNVLLHPLQKYPGPRLWAASRIPYAFTCAIGQGHRKILHLHETYGDIVRVAPNELSVCSPEAWKEVFGRCKTAAGEIGKDSLHYAEAKDSILGAPKDKHTQLKRILGRGFSYRAVLEQDQLIRFHVDQLFNILSKHEESKGWEVPIDVNKLFDFVALDIITDLGFGASFHCLSTGEYHPWAKFFLDALPGIAFATAMKQLEILFKLLMALAPKSLVRKHEEMVLLTNSMVEKRLEEADRPDLIQAMCQPISQNERRPLSIQEIKANAQILTMAGYDTTATALAGATFLLVTNASAMHESEINIMSAKNLAYLTAAIDEALRIYPPGGSGMSRQVPEGGAFALNQHIPAGGELPIPHAKVLAERESLLRGFRAQTILSIWQYAMYHSTRNFTQPESFIPERWLNEETDANFSHDRKEAFQPFSFGPRDCIGRK